MDDCCSSPSKEKPSCYIQVNDTATYLCEYIHYYDAVLLLITALDDLESSSMGLALCAPWRVCILHTNKKKKGKHGSFSAHIPAKLAVAHLLFTGNRKNLRQQQKKKQETEPSA